MWFKSLINKIIMEALKLLLEGIELITPQHFIDKYNEYNLICKELVIKVNEFLPSKYGTYIASEEIVFNHSNTIEVDGETKEITFVIVERVANLYTELGWLVAPMWSINGVRLTFGYEG